MMTRFYRIFALLCALCCLVLLGGCGETAQPPELFTVTYILGGEVYQTQKVEAGSCPNAIAVQQEGLLFAGWQDSNGQAVTPETVPVTGNISYIAQVRVQLTQHVPYLQTDELGFLRPDEALTGAELRWAVEALCAPAALGCLPQLPTDATLTAPQLQEALEHFFKAEDITAALADIREPVTRAGFASAMHKLLGRKSKEPFILGAGAQVPMDLTAEHTDIIPLLEASVRHTTDPEGIHWNDLELRTAWDPGFVNQEGWLYFVKDDGTLLRSSSIGDLQFGPDGRYTSGDGELDVLVAGILDKIIKENPDKTGLDLLRAVYDHCHKDYKYLRKAAYDFGATGWAVKDAKEMITSGRGNCYNFAAIFWALASGLGYDVQCLAGTCTGTDQPHGWVELYYEGAHYFVDPEWQYAYTEREVFDKDMFMLTMDEVWWWTYRWDESAF